jgi:AcrR family transcriptional regulator
MNEPTKRWSRRAPDVRRRQLLDAARALIVIHGYEAMTMAAVAERAGVGKGTLYLYFDSKAELLEGLRDHYWSGMLALASEILERPALSGRARLDQLIDGIVAYSVQNHEHFHAIFDLIPSTDVVPLTELSAMVEGLLREGQESGDFDLVDTAMTARLVTVGLNGLAAPVVHASTAQRPTEIRALKDLFHRVVGAP